MNRCRVLLAFFVVLCVIVLTPLSAEAATNLNPWKATPVKVDLTGQDVNCDVTSRYGVDGERMEVQPSHCRGGFDVSPFSADYGEAGSEGRITFKGTRAGEKTSAAPYQQTVTQTPRYIDVDWAATGSGVKAGTQSGRVYFKNFNPSGGNGWVMGVECINTTTFAPSAGGSETGVTSGSFSATWADWTDFACPAGAAIGSAWAGGWPAGSSVSAATRAAQANRYVFQYAPSNAGTENGAGAGNPCEASSPWTKLTKDTGDGISGIRSVLAGATVPFPDEVGGACIVTSVCMGLRVDSILPGQGLQTQTSCRTANFGALAAAPLAGDTSAEPLPPTADDIAVPDTEQGFWGAILRALAAVGSMIADGLQAVVNAVGSVVGAMLDGIKALFIPPTGFMDSKVATLRDNASDTAPAQYLGAITGQSFAFTSAGCGGIPVDFDLAGQSFDFDLLKACSGTMATTASIVKLAGSAYLVIFGGLACIRALGSGFGWAPGIGKGAGA